MGTKKIYLSWYESLRTNLKEKRINQKKNLFKKKVSKFQHENTPLKIVIGSSKIYEEGWIPSEEFILDLLNEETWKDYFKENEIDCLIAEHVWEHLTIEQGLVAAKTCFKYLKSGGYIRLAVPDGYHEKQEYIDSVKPGGTGLGADDHKVLYNYKTFSRVFEEAGFEVKLLEYFDENKKFNFTEWDDTKGKIRRSLMSDERNTDGKPNYTSLIIDAFKV